MSLRRIGVDPALNESLDDPVRADKDRRGNVVRAVRPGREGAMLTVAQRERQTEIPGH